MAKKPERGKPRERRFVDDRDEIVVYEDGKPVKTLTEKDIPEEERR